MKFLKMFPLTEYDTMKENVFKNYLRRVHDLVL
ncbi:hypothetical protein BN1356_00768 [Streptococcus varani]|uniref:Uncharacterized protein n=1 Tax=Streptococcus varani TaxID=1608583 RepID=A0A0E4H7C6_9STRE|nr:hypothetical protein BN1356_00768 [Streptococcus varani]